MHVPRDPVVRTPRRRQKELEIQAWNGVLRWRVFQPGSRTALRIVGQVGAILGPFLVKVIGGQVKLPARTRCPVCANDEPEVINGERWLCPPERRGALTDEQMAAHASAGPAVWDRTWLLDEHGQPRRLTMGYALSDPRMMGMLAQAVHDRLSAMALGGDELDELICGLLVNACEVQAPGTTEWTPIDSAERLERQADECEDGGAALLQLAAAALECWAFPMLRGALGAGTPRDTTVTETAGDSNPSPPTPTAAPSPAAGRALPRVAKRRG